VNVFSRDLEAIHAGAPARPEVLVSVGPPAPAETAPLRVESVRYERVLSHIKHVGTFGLFHHQRRARARGFDDALFTDSAGRISEGTIWNIGCYDGRGVVWPNAPALPGITMRLMQAGLARAGVPTESREIRLADLRSFHAAFATNSVSPARPIESIDDVRFPVDPEVTAMLTECYRTNPEEPVQSHD
jgi:branched-subunit amino acid aminotransferase/4-amino-4-deoxychorismate lyase